MFHGQLFDASTFFFVSLNFHKRVARRFEDDSKATPTDESLFCIRCTEPIIGRVSTVLLRLWPWLHEYIVDRNVPWPDTIRTFSMALLPSCSEKNNVVVLNFDQWSRRLNCLNYFCLRLRIIYLFICRMHLVSMFTYIPITKHTYLYFKRKYSFLACLYFSLKVNNSKYQEFYRNPNFSLNI